MPVTNPQDIARLPLGVELDDGRCAVVIPEGTPYPTAAPIYRDFYTAVAAQQRVDVNISEGEQQLASQNELVGFVSRSLPEGLPSTTTVLADVAGFAGAFSPRDSHPEPLDVARDVPVEG